MSFAHTQVEDEVDCQLEAQQEPQQEPQLESQQGGCELLTPQLRSRRAKQLAELGYLIARVVPVFESDDEDEDEPSRPSLQGGPLRHGGLREALEGAVEISLALRGALPPCVEVEASAVRVAGDQMFRVRTLEATGLCLVLPELRRLAPNDLMHPDDSEALMVWKNLSAGAPLVLLLDDRDREVLMLAPTPLGEVLGCVDEPPAGWPDDSRANASVLPAAMDSETNAEIDEDDEGVNEPPLPLPSVDAPPVAEPMTSTKGRVMPLDPLDGIENISADELPTSERGADPSLPIQPSLFDAVKEERMENKSPLSADVVRQLCDDLDEVQGPKPVSTVEELFKTRYTPLLDALGRGLIDPVACAVVDDWRSAFEKSYSDAFTAMKATLKRPTMVLDAPDVASRIARLNGARGVQLLLVDSMRFDLAERVRDELKLRVAERAVCVEETLMWSALPTITPVQMRLLSRGPRGLREPDPKSEREPTIQRDGSVSNLRRVRIGHRDLIKLDLVEARLRDAGGSLDDRMSAIANEVADVIAHFTESLAPRTLLFVFGDHGFRLPVRANGSTGPATQGGASPEEVLVSGQAWLVGDVH